MVQQFKYLGAMITDDAEMYKEMDTRMKKAGAVFSAQMGWERPQWYESNAELIKGKKFWILELIMSTQ